MTNKINNTESFKNDLVSQNGASGQKGLWIGRSSLLSKVLPLTDYLINHLWKAKEGDSKAIVAAKGVARGFTYLFSVATAAPLYQFLAHALPKDATIATYHTEHAKKILDSLSHYNQLREEIVHAAEHERDYLAPHNIERREEQIEKDGGIVIPLSSEEKARAKENIRRLKREKNENYDVVLQEQVKEVVEYLKPLTSEERKTAYREIAGALITHVGFDDLFSSKDKRIDFAINVSNLIGVQFIKEMVQENLHIVSTDFNFINFNGNTKLLTAEIVDLFGISQDMAKTLVAVATTEAIVAKYGSLEKFSSHFTPHLEDVTRTDAVEFRTYIDCVQNEYNNTIEELDIVYQDLINAAVLSETDEALTLLNREIGNLRKEGKKLGDSLVAINEKLQALANKKSFYMEKPFYIPKKLTKTLDELQAEKKEVEAKYREIIKELQSKLKTLSTINHQKDIDFNSPKIVALKKTASDHMELERKVRETHANLGVKNTRAFRAFLHLAQGVNLKTPAERQVSHILSLAEHLDNESLSFATTWESARNFFGFGPKRIPVDLFDVLREHMSTFLVDSLQARKALETVYTAMTSSQKAYFAQAIASHLGKTARFSKASATAFGKAYIKAYIEGKEAVGDIKIAPSVIKHVVNSTQGKEAATYQPYTRLNDYLWQEAAQKA